MLKKISKKHWLVATNIFNSYEDSIKLRTKCKNMGISLIEDNAIYFGNFKKINNKKICWKLRVILLIVLILKNISIMYEVLRQTIKIFMNLQLTN